uniref:Uncharacterized protein n=1 Tax=Rhizophora mucronata TaxID=61149 RepID=A0A2P2N4C4_RHIMU
MIALAWSNVSFIQLCKYKFKSLLNICQLPPEEKTEGSFRLTY